MLQVTHDELKDLLKQYYKKKLALFVYGRFGIGKSEVTTRSCEEIAKEKGRQFVVWARMSEEEKKDAFINPSKYFVFIDIRLSEYDSSDIKGLPMFMDDKRSITFKVPTWALLMEEKDSDGILFFDEINLAPPLVMSSCYKIIYDRVINDSKINDNWGIFGAGNLDEDRAYTNHIAPPLKDRGGEVELVGASADKWTQWAISQDVNNLIIGFINFKNSALYKVDFDDKQKYTTYRGWARLSKLIGSDYLEGDGKKDYKKLLLMCQSAIGEGVASEFVAFCKINEEIDLPSIIKEPDKLKKIEEVSILWFINTAIADQYKANKIKFDKVLDVSKVLDGMDQVELVAYLWKMCQGLCKEKFRKDFVTKTGADQDKIVNKYTKYLMP